MAQAPPALRVAAETVRRDVLLLLLFPLFTPWLQGSKQGTVSPETQKHSRLSQELCSALFWHRGQEPWFLPSGAELSVRKVGSSGAPGFAGARPSAAWTASPCHVWAQR